MQKKRGLLSLLFTSDYLQFTRQTADNWSYSGMREQPEDPVFGLETRKLSPNNPPRVKLWRSVVKAISWRTVGTIDTLILSYVLITYLGPYFGMESEGGEALQAASYIAITEIVTKMTFYFLHERVWSRIKWGISVSGGKRRESYGRTTTKTISWRTIASLDTMMLAWFFTGNIATAISIGGLEIFSKMILYFIHERIWSSLSFGIVERPVNPPAGGKVVKKDKLAGGALKRR